MKQIASFLSGIIHPLLMPFLGTIVILLYSFVSMLPFVNKLIVAGAVLTFTALLPALAIVVLYKLGRIKTVGLNDREDRLVPYIICLVGYLSCIIFMKQIELPLWCISFLIGGLCSIIINSIVNRWWKISAHQAGIGGLLAVVVALPHTPLYMGQPLWLLPVAIIATGMLGTSRIYLNRHTFWQVIAGTANGFLCTYICTRILV